MAEGHVINPSRGRVVNYAPTARGAAESKRAAPRTAVDWVAPRYGEDIGGNRDTSDAPEVDSTEGN